MLANEAKKRLFYYTLCIGAFAKAKHIGRQAAFNYLLQFQGINFLIDCYEAEHTLSLDNAVEDLTIICHNNGGNIE
ncbi:MAG: DUF3791 domain-containing protein [Spirochaetaceae bacterium]|jgi:hypothetical protein|nr:DUF3791 domain-containing protein [Spirochaetaceae bacterium]